MLILQRLLEEFKPFSLVKIVCCIERTIHYDEAVFPEEILGLNTEHCTVLEGMVRYDLHFSACLPEVKMTSICILIRNRKNIS